jgi:hypothetical protein
VCFCLSDLSSSTETNRSEEDARTGGLVMKIIEGLSTDRMNVEYLNTKRTAMCVLCGDVIPKDMKRVRITIIIGHRNTFAKSAHKDCFLRAFEGTISEVYKGEMNIHL